MAKARKSGVVNKKLQRKQALFFKHEPKSDVKFQEDPSCHVFIANGGLQNGLSRELLKHILRESERGLKELYLPAGKDYAFATFVSPEAASTAVTSLNGVCVQEECTSAGSQELFPQLLNPKLLSGPPLHLYLCFVDMVPQPYTNPPVAENTTSDLPPGLVLIKEFVSEAEERELLDFFRATTHCSDHSQSCLYASKSPTRQESTHQSDEHLTIGEDESAFEAPEKFLRHRYVKHYGYEFLYSISNVDPNSPLPGGLPAICRPLLKRMSEGKLVEEEPDQLTVNHYQPGAGIPPHVDTHSAFEGSIISLSLGSHVVMDFRHPDGRKIPVFLPRRSLLVMAGESRYLWTHGIAARHCDEVHSEMPGYKDSTAFQPHQSRASTATILPRRTRVSLTFRKVQRKRPCVCVCSYPLLCDSKQH